MTDEARRWRSTTILAVRHLGKVALGGDGQVTLGQTVMKSDAVKIRKFREGSVLVGFAGSAADAFALLERFEARLKDFQGNVTKAATELAKDWRTDRALRRLEAMMIVADAKTLLLVSGTGDVISPSDGILGIGSGERWRSPPPGRWLPMPISRLAASSASPFRSREISASTPTRISSWRN